MFEVVYSNSIKRARFRKSLCISTGNFNFIPETRCCSLYAWTILWRRKRSAEKPLNCFKRIWKRSWRGWLAVFREIRRFLFLWIWSKI